MQRLVRHIVLAFIAALPLAAVAREDSGVCAPDTTIHDGVKAKGNIFSRVISYFDDTNKPKPKKKFDVSFIGVPHT